MLQFQIQFFKESRRLDQPSKSSKKNMEVQVNFIFQKRSTTSLRMKIGDMINGQNSIKERMLLISMMLILKLNLMLLKKKRMKF